MNTHKLSTPLKRINATMNCIANAWQHNFTQSILVTVIMVNFNIRPISVHSVLHSLTSWKLPEIAHMQAIFCSSITLLGKYLHAHGLIYIKPKLA